MNNYIYFITTLFYEKQNWKQDLALIYTGIGKQSATYSWLSTLYRLLQVYFNKTWSSMDYFIPWYFSDLKCVTKKTWCCCLWSWKKVSSLTTFPRFAIGVNPNSLLDFYVIEQTLLNRWLIHYHLAGNYMFKVNNKNAIGVVLVSLLSTLNIFHTLL